MKKIDNILETFLCKTFISANPGKRETLENLINSFPKEWSKSKIISRTKIIVAILQNNDNGYESIVEEYFNTNSTKRKLEIKYGKHHVDQFTKKLKKRNKPNVVSHLTIEYWLKRGFSLEDAKMKISKTQRNNAFKRSKSSYKNFSKKIKHSLDYWMKLGYSVEEAEILREPYLDKCKNNLECMIERHGENLGTKKYFSRIEKYKSSMIDNIGNRKTGGYVSKESLKFFIPLYKYCRKLGLKREDIFLGVTGSKEFFIKDNNANYNTGKFYDFTIKSLKIIVEYNGTYWHPRNREEWKNPTDFDTALASDIYKQNLAKNIGMDYNVVWSDDDKVEALNYLKQHIKETYVNSL